MIVHKRSPEKKFNCLQPAYLSNEKISASLFFFPFISEAMISPATWLNVIPLPPNPRAKKLFGNFL
jgi:hypothetical protein